MKLNELICVDDNINLDEYIEFRENVKENMEHPEWLGDFSKEDLIHLLNSNSKIWIYYLNEVPVCSMMLIPSDKNALSKFELDFDYKEVVDYGPMFVNPKYVGNGLQFQMLQELDKYCLRLGYKYAVSTIHPDNLYSINNLVRDNFVFISTRKFRRGVRSIYLKKLISNNYYKAYDKRYKQVHDKNLSWASNNNTKLVEEIINKYGLQKLEMLEIGCGEGRDARYLLKNGYNVLATDVSSEAICYCKGADKNHFDKYEVLDVLECNDFNKKFGFIYSIACIHMLVLEMDRKKYYQFIYNHLNDDGLCLILSMGNGKKEFQSDISKAWFDSIRIHEETNKKMNIATTSCKIVNFDTIFKEVEDNGLRVLEHGITQIIPDFPEIMYVLVKK